jgi:hypothetical protein
MMVFMQRAYVSTVGVSKQVMILYINYTVVSEPGKSWSKLTSEIISGGN